jgi:hypothetical protein
MGIGPVQCSLNLLAIRIEKKFMGVEAMTVFGGVWTVDSVSVELAGTTFWQIAVPDHISLLGERDAESFTSSGIIEQAEINFFRMFRVKCEVDPLAIPC